MRPEGAGPWHWTVDAPGPGNRIVSHSGCHSVIGSKTRNPGWVTCPRCKCLPSYLRAKAEADAETS